MPANRTFVLTEVYSHGIDIYSHGAMLLTAKHTKCLGGTFELDLGTVKNGSVRPLEDADFTFSFVVSFNEEDLIPAVELLEGQIRCKCFYFILGNKDGVIIPYKE